LADRKLRWWARIQLQEERLQEETADCSRKNLQYAEDITQFGKKQVPPLQLDHIHRQLNEYSNSRNVPGIQREMEDLSKLGLAMLETQEGQRFQQAASQVIGRLAMELCNDPIGCMKVLGRLALQLGKDNPKKCLAMFLALLLILAADFYFNKGRCTKTLFKLLWDNWHILGAVGSGAGGLAAFVAAGITVEDSSFT